MSFDCPRHGKILYGSHCTDNDCECKASSGNSDLLKVRKYLVQKEAVCSDCEPAQEFDGPGSVDAWAKQHAKETGHIVTIHECHDVNMVPW